MEDKEILEKIQEIQEKLEHLILEIPSGDVRNAVCDANINLIDAQIRQINAMQKKLNNILKS